MLKQAKYPVVQQEKSLDCAAVLYLVSLLVLMRADSYAPVLPEEQPSVQVQMPVYSR